MPKRSDREEFSEAFAKNPFKGKSLKEIYKSLQWGNKPQKYIKIDAPEALILLGELALIKFDKCIQEFDEGEYFLAVGANTNFLYVFDIDCRFIPSEDWQKGNKVLETHYYSNKGGEEAYYYHNHEKPYPLLCTNSEVDDCYLIFPENFNDQRSYAVIKEGIVG